MENEEHKYFNLISISISYGRRFSLCGFVAKIDFDITKSVFCNKKDCLGALGIA